MHVLYSTASKIIGGISYIIIIIIIYIATYIA